MSGWSSALLKISTVRPSQLPGVEGVRRCSGGDREDTRDVEQGIQGQSR